MLWPFLEYLEKEKIDVDDYLTANDLPTKKIIFASECQLSTPLIYLFIEDISTAEKIDDFGWRVAEFAGLSFLGVITKLALSAKTLKEALESFVFYSSLGASHASFFIIDNGDSINFCHKGGIEQLSKGYYQVELCLLSFFIQVIEHILGKKFCPNRIGFRSFVDDFMPLAHIEGGRSYFYLSIPKNLLNTKLSQQNSNQDKRELLKEHYQPDNSVNYNIAERLKILLASYSISQLPSLKVVAGMAETSPRILQRELLKLNTSYSAIVTCIKTDKAKELLTDKKLSVLEVSKILSYKHSTHFIRAFKLATGETPKSFQKRSLLRL